MLGIASILVELSPYRDAPDLSCYSRAEAESLSAALAESKAIEGRITPRFDSTVICGFVENTRAVCWRFSPSERAFVKVGEWIT